MREWRADVAIDESLVRRLIAGQFPELELGSLRPFAEGWDNAVWLVEDRWAFRFPRRTIAIPGIERELAVLPRLAPRLPVGIPAPVFAGRPALGYPWPFFGAALLPGIEAGDAALIDDARIRMAPALARFLRTLHDTEVEDDLPVDPNRRSDMPHRIQLSSGWLTELEREGVWRAPATVAELFAEAEALPAATGSVLCHGDLHFRHALVDEAGALSGVIDWGDLCRGDPSIDLSLCAALALYGHHEGLAGVRREALEGLERTVA